MAEAIATPTTSTPNAEVQPTTVETPRLFKVKVDGADIDVDEATLIRDYQTSAAANKRFQEAAQTRQQAEEVLKIFKENPKKAFEKLGVNAKEFAEMVLNEHMQNEMLSPDQRRLKEYEEKLAAFEAEKKAQKDAADQAELSQMEQRYMADYDRQFTEALATSGLPKNAHTIRSMAYYMKVALDNGYQDITPQQVVSYVRNDYQESIKELFGTSDENTLLSFLGDDLTNRVVKGHLNKMKPAPVPRNKPLNTVETPTSKKPAKMTTTEYFRKLKRGEL